METYTVTIAREYGSGGRLIGQELAKELGIAFYDRELIVLAAKESGLAEEFVQKMEYKRIISFINNLYMTSYELPVSEKIFLVQCKVIRQVAEECSCVIVGRCADYVLRDKPNCIRVFIHAPMEERIKRIREVYREEQPNLEDFIQKQDKNRASYYNYYTHGKWGKAQNYHLCIDSSIGIPASVRIIKELVTEYTSSTSS
jgi:cytidylate kinase